jgi:hypothetical protein
LKRYSKKAWWRVGSFVVIVVFVVGMAALLLRGLDEGCGKFVLAEEISPDGKWKAVVFNVDCGATTTDKEMDPRVSLLKTDQQLSSHDSGNIFSVRSNGQAQRPIVRANWTGRDELTIRYPARVRTFGNVNKYKDITIKYVAEP